MAENYQKQEVCLYKEWMKLQEEELLELIQQSLNYNNPTNTSDLDAETNSLLDKIIQHFQDYSDRRLRLATDDVAAFLAPRWCTTFENSMSWIGGCRPSTYFSLIYALCGTDIESRLSQFLRDGHSDFPHLSSSQLCSIDNLQRRTITEEDKLTRKMASLQQDLTDDPLALMARNSGPKCELTVDVRSTIGPTERAMFSTMEEADKLRLNTVKEIVEVLKPSQALDYIIAGKKLRLCVQSWGLEKDRERGRD